MLNSANTFIIHGTEDEVVPFERAEELKDKLEKLKIPYEFHPIEDEGHAPWKHIDKIKLWIRDFLFKFLNPSP